MSAGAARTVLVTGGARRLGRGIALELAAAGWQVAIHYRDSEHAAQQTVEECRRHAPAEAFQAELSDETHPRELFDQVLELWSRHALRDHFGHRRQNFKARSSGGMAS